MTRNKIGNVDVRRAAARVLSVLVMCALIFTGTAVPNGAYAASKKAKYSISVNNINSNTVIRKGTTLKIQASATVTRNGVAKSTPVKFKSSKKKVATVSSKGKIKAKKKGTTYITVYCKKKTSKKKKIKIRVGTPVSSISVSGSRYLNRGRSSTLKASVNSGATNKSVTWWSDNPAVATVTSSGKVTAKGYGTCNVYATAKDGSGVSGARTIIVHHYERDEVLWIAHRGLHTKYTENTANAFRAAGDNGFKACECDVWETRHSTYNVVLPDLPTPPTEPIMGTAEADETQTEENAAEVDGSEGSVQSDLSTDTLTTSISGSDTDVDAVVAAINGLSLKNKKTTDDILDISEDIKSAYTSYVALTDAQKSKVRAALMSGTDDGLSIFLNAYAKVYEYESYDIAINHDATFSRTMGYSASVKSMSADEIKSMLPNVCFLNGYDNNGSHVEGYLDICKAYGMVPVIELKDPSMSREAVRKIVEMVESKGLQDSAIYISFYTGPLSTAKEYAEKNPSVDKAKTYYLFSSDVMDGVETARNMGYTGVSVKITVFSADMYNRAKSYGLGVGTWTYKNDLSSDGYLYEQVGSHRYQLDFATLDHKAFN